MVYDNNVQRIRVLTKKVVTSLLQKIKKDKENKKPKQVKALAFLCANKQTKTNEQGNLPSFQFFSFF